MPADIEHLLRPADRGIRVSENTDLERQEKKRAGYTPHRGEHGYPGSDHGGKPGRSFNARDGKVHFFHLPFYALEICQERSLSMMLP